MTYADTDEIDILDLRAVENHERMLTAQAEVSRGEFAAYVERVRLAYSEVFSPGATSKAAIDLVLLDIAVHARLMSSSFSAESHAQMALVEGRREVVRRLLAFSRLSYEELMRQYIAETTQV